MAQTKLSSKYQLVIPKEIRKEIGLKVGEKLTILAKDGIISLIPSQTIKSMRGYVKGIKWGDYRDEED
jgi:AbrB family looped-hinge helix DNA binding protein